MIKTLRATALLIPCVLMLAGSLAAQTEVLEFDPAQTKVQFTLADVLHTVQGTFKLKRGNIRIDAASGAVSGEIVVDATSVCEDGKRPTARPGAVLRGMAQLRTSP